MAPERRQQSRLELLPAEIRNKIYGLVLEDHELSLDRMAEPMQLVQRVGVTRHYYMPSLAMYEEADIEDDWRIAQSGPRQRGIESRLFMPSGYYGYSAGAQDLPQARKMKSLFSLSRSCKSVREDFLPMVFPHLSFQIQCMSDVCWFSVRSKDGWGFKVVSLSIRDLIPHWLDQEKKLRWINVMLKRLPSLKNLGLHVENYQVYPREESPLMVYRWRDGAEKGRGFRLDDLLLMEHILDHHGMVAVARAPRPAERKTPRYIEFTADTRWTRSDLQDLDIGRELGEHQGPPGFHGGVWYNHTTT